MTPDQIYRNTRTRLLSLAADLTDDEPKTPAPALPGWTVRDVFGHLAGVCADALDDNMDDAEDPVWTQAQVGSRHRYLLSEVCAEWQRRGPELDKLLTAPDYRWRLLAADAWHHEQDVRAALGRPCDDDAQTCRAVADLSVTWTAETWPQDLALRLIAADDEWTLGSAEPQASLRSSHYELARATLGRRSRSQILAMDWSGDPQPHLDHLAVFDLPKIDLLE